MGVATDWLSLKVQLNCNRVRVFIMRPHKNSDPSNKVKAAAEAKDKLCVVWPISGI